MEKYMMKNPNTLNNINFVLLGKGTPAWGDPRNAGIKKLSKHIVWLCRREPMTAKQMSEELNVPAIYIEEELETLTKGENGEYGLLRRLDNDKFAINFILLDKKAIDKAHYLYITQLLEIADIIEKFIQENKERFLKFPYMNHKIDWNLILWQQIFVMSRAFSKTVNRILNKKYFSGIARTERPFNVYGYEDKNNETACSIGWDSVNAKNICGYSEINFENIYNKWIKSHFYCGHNVANDFELQLAIQAINGIDIKSLFEQEKEHAAKAIECGYIYREGNILYTKILVSNTSDAERLFEISDELAKGYFNAPAEKVAADIAKLIYENVPEHLFGEWEFANQLADIPILDALADILIDKEILIPPKDGVGAEGCWMSVGQNWEETVLCLYP